LYRKIDADATTKQPNITAFRRSLCVVPLAAKHVMRQIATAHSVASYGLYGHSQPFRVEGRGEKNAVHAGFTLKSTTESVIKMLGMIVIKLSFRPLDGS
jgi:hypothetical protein